MSLYRVRASVDDLRRCRFCNKRLADHIMMKDRRALCPNRRGGVFSPSMLVTMVPNRIAEALAETRARNQARLKRALKV